MSNHFGSALGLTIFGQSHAPAIGMTLEGLPAGFAIDFDQLNAFLQRRAPGNSPLATARKEADVPEFLSGLVGNVTCGAPLTAIIRNENTRGRDYEALRAMPRPGHADFAAHARFGDARDVAGGGQFSGRLTAPLCIAGGVCLQILQTMGIQISARILQIAGMENQADWEAAILAAKAEGDSVGGVIECAVTGVPAGVGEPMFGGMENRIAQLVFGIPAVKGVEFGAGFAAARLRGSENNDPFFYDKGGRVVTCTNHAGGILGGITTGMPIVFRAAFKPTPSIAKTQQTVDLTTGQNAELRITGRHDPCIVPRAVPCVEAATAVALLDAILERKQMEGFSWT